MSLWESLDRAPFNGGEIICRHFSYSPVTANANKDPHYRVFLKHKDGTISSERKYTIDVVNSYIKNVMNSNGDIVDYMLCSWVNNEYRECRHSKGWDIDLKDLNIPTK